MKIRRNIWHLGALAAAGVFSLFFQGCDVKFYDSCPADHIAGNWGVIDKSRIFGEYDSLYYLVNPIGNVSDTVYYNGNYTDSYYHSDPMRAMVRFTAQDSIQFCLERLYQTQTNPRNIVMTIREEGTGGKSDHKTRECVLHLRREETQENLYKTRPDSLFKEMLASERTLRITATNGISSSEPSGSQNYEFTLVTKGFGRALEIADSLNALRHKPKAKEDDNSGESKDKHDTAKNTRGNVHKTKEHKSHHKTAK